MSRDFPDWINPWTAAQGRRRFAGTVPLKRMDRLIPSLHRVGDGTCAFEARFALDNERRPVIELAVAADLVLLCQASLEPYLEHIERRSTLGVVETDGDVEILPPHYDPVFADNGRLALATLVEDELILGLPEVPRNPEIGAFEFSTGETVPKADGDPRQQTTAGAEGPGTADRPNPFAVLKGKVGQAD